jgi:non-specific serine/threonine protein kinase
MDAHDRPAIPGELTMQRRQLMLGLPLALIATPQAAMTKWVRRADMPVARSETPATVLDGLVYVAGGFGAGARADRYDPATDEWARLADLPVETNHPGIAAYEDQVIVAGGYSMDGAGAHRGMWAYRAAADRWEQIGELPEPMGAFGFVEVDNDLYLVGGALASLNGEPSAATWRWLSREARWEERAPMAHAREHMAVVATGGRIFAVGGRAHGQDSDELGSAVERYDPATNTWESLTPLPYPRSGLNGAPARGGVIVAGGETSRKVFADVQFLAAPSDNWESLPDLPVAVHGVAIATVGRRLYAFGGSTLAGRVQNIPAVEELNLETALGACASGR